MIGIEKSLEERFAKGKAEIALDKDKEGLVKLVRLDEENPLHILNPGSYVVSLTNEVYIQGLCTTSQRIELRKHNVSSICPFKANYSAMKGKSERSYILVIEEEVRNLDLLPFTPIDDSEKSNTIKDIYEVCKGVEIQKLKPKYEYCESVHDIPETIIPLSFNPNTDMVIEESSFNMSYVGVRIEPGKKHGIVSRSDRPTYIMSIKER